MTDPISLLTSSLRAVPLICGIWLLARGASGHDATLNYIVGALGVWFYVFLAARAGATADTDAGGSSA